MKKKHYIKDISDIKYCEENGIEVYDDYQTIVCFRFVDGVWCSYTNKNLNAYNVKLSLNSLYYEEEPEEQQEASEKDFGKLCWFWAGFEECRILSVLKDIDKEPCTHKYETLEGNWWTHCRPLTKEEIKEFMERA